MRLGRDGDHRGIDFAQHFAIVGHPPGTVLIGQVATGRFVEFGDRGEADTGQGRQNPGVMLTQRSGANHNKVEGVHAALRRGCSAWVGVEGVGVVDAGVAGD